MNKSIIGALVGGLLIFIWQSLSWTMLNRHDKAMQYTPKQDSIMTYLSSQFSQDGSYILPRPAPGASMEDCKQYVGKSWAQISYHTAKKDNMVSSMLWNYLVNVIAVLLLCFILAGITVNTSGKTLLASLFTGLIIFLQGPFVMHIWYETFDVWVHLTDYLISWGLAGLWLGWWLNKKKNATA